MKKLGKILYYILAGGLALFAIGYLVYEIVWKGILDVSNIMRTLLIVATMILAIYRVASGTGRGKKKHSEQFFRDHYGQHIGRAFIIPSKASKKFFAALEYYQYNQPSKLVDAMRELESACTNNDERFAVVFFKALGYDAMKSYANAAAAYEKALLYREDSTAASNAGSCYQNLEDYDRAIDTYLFAIKIEPDNAYPYNNLAQLYNRKAEYEKALFYAETAIEKKENFRQAYSAKAVASAMLGDYEEFEDAARKYVLYGGDRNALTVHLKQLGSDMV
ncbi:MAG: tetratricopeptide repeat protein [Clostridia bacterium]|nr:tetratricopeptide repeat protein [Clostridia bacterium]